MDIYESGISMVFDTPRGKRERSVHTTYTSESMIGAIYAARRRSEFLVKNWEIFQEEGEINPKLGCIKVHRKFINPISASGADESRIGSTVFEWKYDWPGSLEDYIEFKRTKLDRECVYPDT